MKTPEIRPDTDALVVQFRSVIRDMRRCEIAQMRNLTLAEYEDSAAHVTVLLDAVNRFKAMADMNHWIIEAMENVLLKCAVHRDLMRQYIESVERVASEGIIPELRALTEEEKALYDRLIQEGVICRCMKF